MSKLKAEVGPSEAVDGNGEFDDLAPPGAVVVVEDEGAVLRDVGLPRAQTDAVLGATGESSAFIWPVAAMLLPPYLQDLSIGVDDVNGDFNVLLNALSSSLKVPSLQSQVQVVTDVTCGG